jgi:hypothetical protein
MFIPIQSTKKLLLFFCAYFFFFADVFATTKTWTGLAGDGNWSTVTNWSGGTLPTSTDNVLLDNSFVTTSYTVTMPSTAVAIKSIVISPLTGKSIKVILPSTNLYMPAFTASGPGYGIVINNGGIFQNSSGNSSGSAMSIADSIKINNGGRYIHNTRSSHAANIVQILSKAPGTETGIFEFNTSGTQGYTISISNRTYGTLVLSADASPGGVKTYTGTGSNPLNIRGNFQIGGGVTFKSDLATLNGNINVDGDYIQNGGVFNLASGPDNSSMKINGNLIQSSGSSITESSSGLPAIELNGISQQNVSMQGTLSNNIAFIMNNAAGAVLQAPLSLPYKLNLVKGNITTTSNNLLTLQPGATISVDSTITNNSFINGPLRKEGLSAGDYFLFPVGKPNEFRWVELKKATGNFTAEFIADNPRNLSTSYGSGIDHISSHGYWAVEADASPSPSAQVELSFANASGSGVTDMATLRASQLTANGWLNRNNIATTGTPGAAGSVVSETIASFGSSANNFVLASSVPNENPLPVVLTSFAATKINDDIKLNWEVASADDIDYFEIWSAAENNNFEKTDNVMAESNKTKYQCSDKQILNGVRYYKLRIIEKDGNAFFSKTILIKNEDDVFKILSIAPSPIYDNATVSVYTNERAQLQFIITSIDGKIIKRRFFNVERGRNMIPCDFSGLASGSYVLSCFDSKGNIGVVRFIKL